MDEIVERLAALPESAWRESSIEGESVAWLPIVQVSDTGLWLGLDRRGEWVLGRPAANRFFKSSLDTIMARIA